MTAQEAPRWIRPLFLVSGVYDLALGAAFMLAYRPIFEALKIELPNHAAYMHFPAGVVLALGVGFLLVARAPARNRDLILVGVLFKLAFAGTVLWHLLLGSIPTLWVPLGALDVLFAVVFVAAWRAIGAGS